MSDGFTLSGVRVIEGRVDMPRVGAWVADLELDTETGQDGDVLLDLRGDLTLAGAIVATGLYEGRCKVRVVGGAGGLGKAVIARDYRLTPAKIPIVDALTEGGETLSPTADPERLGRFLESWTRTAGTVGEAFRALVTELGASWRVLPDGTVWLGDEAWPASRAKRVVMLYEDAKDGRLEFTTESAVLPGTMVDNQRLSRVVLHIAAESVTYEAWTDAATGPTPLGERLLESLARLVRTIMGRVDFFALYSARVVTQNSDGSLDLLPDDPRMPSKARVPIRSLPGVVVKVAAGARVLMAFENGDPKKPIATLWEPSGLISIAVAGERPVARMGDQILATLPPMLPITGTVGTGPSSMPFIGTMTIATPLTGQIISGSDKLLA